MKKRHERYKKDGTEGNIETNISICVLYLMKRPDKRQKDRKKMAVGGDGFEGYGDEAELLSQQRPSFPDTESSTLL